MCTPGEYCQAGAKLTDAGAAAGMLANGTYPCGNGQYCKDYAAGASGMYTWLSDYMDAFLPAPLTIEELHPSFSSCPYDAQCPCEGGYHCPGGENGDHAFRAAWTRCSAGEYCPAGSAQPVKCPAGTFSESWGASSIDDCQPCPPGYACLVEGLT